jgi:predicted metal-dependent hydrolase
MTPATVERSSVRYGNKVIDYAIRRSPRRTTVSIAIDPTDGVLVTAPKPAPVTRLDGIVHAKARWITERLKRQSDRPPMPTAKEFVSGETFFYLGRQYRLKLELGAAPMPVRLERGWLRLPIPRHLPDAHRSNFARAALIDWYKQQAGRQLPQRLRVWSRKLKVETPPLAIAEPEKRWGSATSSGTIRLNWRIVQASVSLIDYVVAHELAHLIHPNHTRKFWATLGSVMPTYETRKRRLATSGDRFGW